MKNKIKRITFTSSEVIEEKLKEIRKTLGLTSNSSVFQHAIGKLHEDIQKEKRRGEIISV